MNVFVSKVVCIIHTRVSPPVNFAPFKNELDRVDLVVYGGHMFGSVGTI